MPTSNDDNSGFIGKYSKKMNAVKQMKEEQQKSEDSSADFKPSIPLSKNAPKHKGMLARVMEMDQKE